MEYKNGDIVVFKVGTDELVYTVEYTYLSNKRGYNDEIFKRLGIRDKYKFCSEIYGYSSSSGEWPSTKEHDYRSLSKVINKLLEMTGQKKTTINIKSNTINKFMENVKTFYKNMTISKEEKLLRKHGLKTECGTWTDEAKDIAMQMLCDSKQAELTQIVTDMEAEEKNNK